MAKTVRPQPPKSHNTQPSLQVLAQQTQYQGPIPHPEDLARYEAIIIGSAERILSMAENESRHRQAQENARLNADVAAQQKQIEIAKLQTKAVFRSDMLGQMLGAAVSFASIAGCVYLAIAGQPWVASALVGLPLAGVIRALRDRPKPARNP